MNPFLLEIGTEEIPDWMIPPAINQLAELFQDLLDRNRLGGSVDSVDATPRRLALRAAGLIERQQDSEELVLGPPKSAGQGAAAGFAKKMGTTPDQLNVETNPKGEYFAFKKLTQGKQTQDILAAELPQLILKIHFPKTMYWNGKGSERFIRPIRWVLASFCNSVVPFEIAGLKSGSTTQGHRLLGKGSVPVTIDNFEQQLEANGVILAADKRRKKIEVEISRLLEGTNLRVRPDPALLETLVYITEFPTPILGGFDLQYLELPKEVLVTVMRHHQKYFSLEDANGNLAPNFIAVMNTNADPEGLVRHGNERVLRARFNDARFFWQVDQKKKLEDRLPDLANVTFQAKLGSYLEKTNRVVTLVKQLGGNAAAQRAALLAKCDLTTDMVKEFTDLQGIVGGLYAKAQGETEEVARAIYDHYRPLSMEDEIPSTLEGCNVAIADKLDTLKGCFSVGLIPSGSRDPFGLRRAALGVVKILDQKNISITILDFLSGDSELQNFFLERIKYYFEEIRGHAYDEVNAAVNAGWSNLLDLRFRLNALKDIRPVPDFEAIAASFKRIKKILPADFQAGTIDTTILEDGPERELFEASQEAHQEFAQFRALLQYSKALHRIAGLRPKVDRFFDKVLVNAPDEALRRNRLTLLHNLLTEFSGIADFSEIITERETRNERRETNL